MATGILEQILQIVTEHTAQFDSLKKAISELRDTSKDDLTHEWLTIEQLIAFLPDHPSRSTIYSWVHKSEIPYHKRGKRLLFSKSEITSWLKNSRRSTLLEVHHEVESQFSLNQFKASNGKTRKH